MNSEQPPPVASLELPRKPDPGGEVRRRFFMTASSIAMPPQPRKLWCCNGGGSVSAQGIRFLAHGSLASKTT